MIIIAPAGIVNRIITPEKFMGPVLGRLSALRRPRGVYKQLDNKARICMPPGLPPYADTLTPPPKPPAILSGGTPIPLRPCRAFKAGPRPPINLPLAITSA